MYSVYCRYLSLMMWGMLLLLVSSLSSRMYSVFLVLTTWELTCNIFRSIISKRTEGKQAENQPSRFMAGGKVFGFDPHC